MNALINALPAYFKPSYTQQIEDFNKRAVDPSSNANGGFGNNSSQKTSFPAGTAKSTPASTKSTPASSSAPTNTPSSSSPSSSSSTPTSSSSPASSPSASLPTSAASITNASISSSTAPTISPSSASDSNNGNNGLSGGAIGAIVAVIVIIISGISAFFIMRRRRQKRIAARAGAGAMRDPYNEGFSSFPPPPAPMAFTADNYNTTPAAAVTTSTNNNNNFNSSAAGSAHYQPQVQQQHFPPLASPPVTYNYQTTNPASYPITAPNMISTPPPTSSSNTSATLANVPAPSNTTHIDPLSVGLATAATGTAAASAFASSTTNNDPQQQQQQQQQATQPGDIWQQTPIGTFTVLTTYTPTLSDEIDVQPNDQVQIFEEYDDGWCLGINITKGQTRGVFPKHCVTPDQGNQTQQQQHQQQLQLANPSSQSLAVSDPVAITTAAKRVSSLYMENPNPVLQ